MSHYHTYYAPSELDDYIEYYLPKDMLNLLPYWTYTVPDDCVVAYQIDPKLNKARVAVAKRDDDFLTRKEINNHWKLSTDALMKELQMHQTIQFGKILQETASSSMMEVLMDGGLAKNQV